MWACTRRGWSRQPEPFPDLVRDQKCSECGEPAALQVTDYMRADLRLKLPNALPRCRRHGQILLRHL